MCIESLPSAVCEAVC